MAVLKYVLFEQSEISFTSLVIKKFQNLIIFVFKLYCSNLTYEYTLKSCHFHRIAVLVYLIKGDWTTQVKLIQDVNYHLEWHLIELKKKILCQMLWLKNQKN